ncbi:MAG: hypothetical protein D6748_14370, partial [Calditrichaeota bacterium]
AGQDLRTQLFGETDKIMQAALNAKADLLAPDNYSRAMKLYREAEEDFNKGKNLEDIRKKLKGSQAYFQQAIEKTKLAEVTFASLLKARSDAIKADAPNFASELWKEAEKKFQEAAKKLEDGNVKGAESRAGEAETIYRKAELDAIKANFLNEAIELVNLAEKQKVKDKAPVTLQRAKDLIAQAEKELNENRYDTDVARSLAQQAKYEAKHAIYLASRVEQMKKNKETLENLLLESEEPLRRIAAALDLVAQFDQGYGPPTETIINTIQSLQDEVERLSQNLEDREQQISDLHARIAELEEKLGAISEEQSELQKRMEAQERIRAQFEAVGKMFSREEARVLRDGNNIIIRLVGLNFDVGQAVIKPKYFSLLTKVQQAIKTFPGSSLTIEGHTDSFGSDQMNLRLSQARAEAVKQYLLANMPELDPNQVEAVGYGESRPIANNETREGRAKNRRIDVVIHPQLPELK